MKKWDTKGQFYILTALILILIAFGLVQGMRPAQQATSAFTEITDNLARESATTINQAIFNQQDVDATFLKFFRSFLTFAKTKNPQFAAMYVLKQDDTLTIHNEMGSKITIKERGIDLESKENATIKSMSIITIAYDNHQYQMIFEGKNTQAKILAVSQNANEKRVKTIDVG